MALEKYIQELKGIKGYKASGIMTFTGDMLASDSVDPGINLEIVGATFNDIFRNAHDAAGQVGLSVATETVIFTPNGTIIMLCSGVHSKVHLHLITVLAKDGNQALAKMTMEKVAPKIVEELA